MSNNKLKPGQNFPTPEPWDGDRVFYETLLHQRPDSIMAQDWCIRYGVLDGKDAEKVHQEMLERKGKISSNVIHEEETMIKIFELVRTSPDRRLLLPSDGKHQTLCIVSARKLFEHENVLPPIQASDITSFKALGVSRYNFLESDTCSELMNALEDTDSNTRVYIFVTQLNRIGVAAKTIKTFLCRVAKNHPRVVIISVTQYGMNLNKLADVLFEYHKQTRGNDGISHNDVGRNLAVSKKDKQQQKIVDNQAKEMRSEWKQYGYPLSLNMHSGNGIIEESYKLVVGDMFQTARQIVRKGDDVHRFLTEFIHQYAMVTSKDQFTYAIYMRRTPKTCPIMTDGVPANQLASCISYAKNMPSLIHNSMLRLYDCSSRKVIKRPGVIKLLSYILWGGLKHVIMKTTNRFASNDDSWHVLNEVCALKNVTIHISNSIGKNYMQLAKLDTLRMRKRHEAQELKKTAIEGMRNKLNGDDKKLSLMLLDIDRKLRVLDKSVDSESDDEDYSTDSDDSSESKV